jgi:hypothetical protein
VRASIQSVIAATEWGFAVRPEETGGNAGFIGHTAEDDPVRDDDDHVVSVESLVSPHEAVADPEVCVHAWISRRLFEEWKRCN